MKEHKDYHDIIGGVLMVGVGLFAIVHGRQYEFGELQRMGPGYFPVVLGAVLALIGVLIAVPAMLRKGTAVHVQWKTFALIMGSIVVFAVSLKTLGIVLATFLSVLVSSLADNETRWKGRLLTCAGVSLLTYVVFILGLSMIIPVWPWSP